MLVSCVSLKLASTHVSPVSTSANSGVPEPTNWPTLKEEAWLTMPSAGALTVVCARS
jgi:hypothetical protein